MLKSLIHPRRVAALVLVLSVAVSLASCGRKDNLVEPLFDVNALPTPVTWTNTIFHLIADRSEGETPTGCTSCHHAGTTLPDWSKYTVVRDYNLANPGLMPFYINSNTLMGQFLKPGEATIINNWISAGMPE